LSLPERSGTLRNVPLSTDPEKRRRQLANLERGGQVAVERHTTAEPGLEPQPATAPAPRAREGLPVVGYTHDVEPEATPMPPASLPAEEGAGDVDVDELELEEPELDEPEAELEHDDVDRGGFGGLLDGLLGR
jgi:hypothetical protein